MKIRFAVGPPAGPVPAPDLISFAGALEASGFDGIWLSDLPVAPVLDPLLALALLSGRTRTLRLGANIVPFGRSPYVLAKALAQLDQLSEGRLLLSFVTGLGQAGEREALGLGGADRGTAGSRRCSNAYGPAGATGARDPLPRRRSPPRALGATRPRAGSAGGLAGRTRAQGTGSCRPARRRMAGSPRHDRGGGHRTSSGSRRRRHPPGREVDPEHFGLSVALCPRRSAAITAGRAHRPPSRCRSAGADPGRQRWPARFSCSATWTPGCRSSSCARPSAPAPGSRKRDGSRMRSSTSRPDAAARYGRVGSSTTSSASGSQSSAGLSACISLRRSRTNAGAPERRRDDQLEQAVEGRRRPWPGSA